MNAPMIPQPSTYADLRKVNVSEFVEKKKNLSYLSWAWAVDQLLQRDPAASWEYRWHDSKPFVSIGETAMVFCTVKAFGVERTAQLPVMDYKNLPIPNPNSFEVNTAMQRALAKAISLHGLGLYIYAGEDLPPGEEAQEPKKAPPITASATMADEYDRLDESGKRWIDGIADAVRDWVSKGDMEGAIAEIDAAIPYTPRPDSNDSGHKLALQSRLDSKTLTALKRARAEQLKKAA